MLRGSRRACIGRDKRVTAGERGGALDQVAEVVGQVRVVTGANRRAGEVAVLAKRDRSQEEVAHGVRAELRRQRAWVDDVAGALRDLAAALCQPPMREYPARQRQAGGEQEGRPVQAVKPNDL